jgi:hypothetical protein
VREKQNIQSETDIAMHIELLHDAVNSLSHAPKVGDSEICSVGDVGSVFDQITFLDSLALTSLQHILQYVDSCWQPDSLDYRSRLLMSDIRGFADSIAIRLLSARNCAHRFNYHYDTVFPAIVPMGDSTYAWIKNTAARLRDEPNLPDDIDSTFSALHAINVHSWKGRFPPTDVIASSIAGIDEIRHPDKPDMFNTWFADMSDPHSPWKSSDIVALSSVAAFFDSAGLGCAQRMKDLIFAKIIAYFQNPIESLWFSEFYHSLPMVIYMISRCRWHNDQARVLIKHIDKLKSSCDQNPRILSQNKTDIHLYNASLIRLSGTMGIDEPDIDMPDIDDDMYSDDMCSGDIADPLFTHSLIDQKTTYASSPLLSALFAFEDMFGKEYLRFMHAGNAVVPKNPESNIPSPYSSPASRQIDRVRGILFDFEILRDYHNVIDRLLSGTDFAMALDMFIALDMRSDHDPLLTHALGLCTYFFYDKIFDQELHPHVLPVLFLTDAVFQSELEHMMDELRNMGVCIPSEISNTLADMDISYYVLTKRGTDPDSTPPLSLHAMKSIGSCLIPALCLLKAGGTARDALKVQDFYMHFNLARQISDDAKDEEDDRSATNPKFTTMRGFETQHEIEHALFQEISYAKEILDSLEHDTARTILRGHLDEFALRVINAKRELDIMQKL